MIIDKNVPWITHLSLRIPSWGSSGRNAQLTGMGIVGREWPICGDARQYNFWA